MRINKNDYWLAMCAAVWRNFGTIIRLLRRHSSPIRVSGDNINILYSPDQFYNVLKDGVARAKQRIIFSSLYLGTQEREQELVTLLEESLSDRKKPDLQCSLLLDYLRGSRGTPNSRTMVQTLVNEYGERFKLSLYHTPNLRGWLKWLGPERFNEVMGLQHMKIYIFDDDLVLSGANLSRDYFVDRQDRYTWFRDCPQLTDYFAELVQIIATHSFSLRPDGTTDTPIGVNMDPLSSRKAAQEFRDSLKTAVIEFIHRQHSFETDTELLTDDKSDTLVFPLVQMGYYGIRQDEQVTKELFQLLEDEDSLSLASGYFNLPPTYVEAILMGRGEYNILAASPQANGFYGGRGVAGHVPAMYTHFAHQFLRQTSSHGFEERIKYMEYFREGWTFHGKGVWFYPAGECLPLLSLIGSSNYGHRSLSRDLEAQVALMTINQKLRESLQEEEARMFDYGKYLSLADVTADTSRKLTFPELIATTILKPHV